MNGRVASAKGVEIDAVDGAHSAASKCHRVLKSRSAPSSEGAFIVLDMTTRLQ